MRNNFMQESSIG